MSKVWLSVITKQWLSAREAKEEMQRVWLSV